MISRGLRVALLVLMAGGLAGVAEAASTLVQILDAQLVIQERLLEEQTVSLERQQADLVRAWSRVDRLAADLVRAHRDDESSESLRLREEDLQLAEGELLVRVLEAQRLRQSLTATRAVAEQLRAELVRLGQGPAAADPISGVWQVVVEPGGQEGLLFLDLNGTIVSGTYQLAGGWNGSVRGTLVAGKIRLERIDSQLGFAAVYFGNVNTQVSPARIEGTWEGTHLAAGMPTAGTWLAIKLEESE